MSRIIAIGDIHGNYDKLMSLWNKLNISSDDKVIFLGDYIDRGNKNIEVISFIMKLSQQDNIICLMGNHEDMFLSYLDKDIWGNDWLHNGGEITLNQLKEKQNILYEFEEFCRNKLLLYYSMIINQQKYIFVHAGINPSSKEQTRDSLLWTRETFYNHYKGNDIFVVGHTVTIYFDFEFKVYAGCYNNDNYAPIKLRNNIYAIDTGSYLDEGKITAWIYDLNDNHIKYMQSSSL